MNLKADHKIMWKHKGSRKAKTALKKESKVEKAT